MTFIEKAILPSLHSTQKYGKANGCAKLRDILFCHHFGLKDSTKQISVLLQILRYSLTHRFCLVVKMLDKLAVFI